MEDLTKRQQEILTMIRDFMDDSGFPPTRADICRVMGFNSPNAAEEHLRTLERKGAIEMLAGASRGIRIKQASGLPLIGRVAAGSPMLAIENQLGFHPVNPSLFNPRADYLLQVRGLSMRDEGILDGDWLVVHRTTEAKSGQPVVARVGDDVTVKRLKMRGHKAELIPANSDFEILYLDLHHDTLAIEGIAVGVIRNLHARA